MDGVVDEFRTRRRWMQLVAVPGGMFHVLSGDYVGCQQWQWNVELQDADMEAARRRFEELRAEAEELERSGKERIPLQECLLRLLRRREG